MTNKWKEKWPNGWWPNCSDGFADLEISIDENEVHQGAPATYLKSSRADFGSMGRPQLTKSCKAKDYQGKRVRLTGWVKTRLETGTANLWLRVDGNWNRLHPKLSCFDNMQDRPILKTTDWTSYSLVVDLPEESTNIVYGIFLQGRGELWLGDVTIEPVSEDIALTGIWAYRWQGELPNGWWPNCCDGFSDLEIGLDQSEIHQGSPTAYLKSNRTNFKDIDCPKLTKSCSPKEFHGKRIRLTGWVKTRLEAGAANLWLRVDGNWTHYPPQAAYFDNMYNRPITDTTDWTNYSLVVDVPKESTNIVYGIFLRGLGELWLGDTAIEPVSNETALTGYNWPLE